METISEASTLLSTPSGLLTDACLSRAADAQIFAEVVSTMKAREQTGLERVLEEQLLTRACAVAMRSWAERSSISLRPRLSGRSTMLLYIELMRAERRTALAASVARRGASTTSTSPRSTVAAVHDCRLPSSPAMAGGFSLRPAAASG